MLLLLLLSTLGTALGLAREPQENGAGFTVSRGALWQLSALAAGIAVVLLIPWPGDWPPFLTLGLVLAIIYVAGFAAGSEAFAFFILGTPSGEVAAWAMSGQAIEDHKGFLRIRIAADGTLTVYPVAVDRICRDWNLGTTERRRPPPGAGRRASAAPAFRTAGDHFQGGISAMNSPRTITRADHVTEVIPFPAGDGTPLTLIHVTVRSAARRRSTGEGAGAAGPRGRGPGRAVPPAAAADPGGCPARGRLGRLAPELAGVHRL